MHTAIERKRSLLPRIVAATLLTILAVACGTTQNPPQTSAMSTPHTDMAMTSEKPTALTKAMRDLWADHVIWTRQYIVAATGNSPDAQAAAARLLENQEQIGQAIVPYYGQEAGTKLTALLKDHILIAVDVVSAAKANDQAKLRDADARWHANAADIATFLSNANPTYWPRAAVLSMMNQHLALTTKEAVARLNKNWTDDIALFDQIFDQAMMMADTLSKGIVQQFPDKFRS